MFSTFLWPIRRYEPERRIIAGIYAELANIAVAPPPAAANASPMTGQISDAQEALAPLARDRSIEAERNVFLLVQAERIRLSLLNTGRLQRRIARHERGTSAADALEQILHRASAALRLIGPRTPANAAIEQLTAGLVQLEALTPQDGNPFFAALLRDARHQCGTLRSQIRAAAWAASATGRRSFRASSGPAANAEADSGDAGQPWRLHLYGYRARLLANLSLNSTVFRHAVRMAACLAVGDIIGRTLVLQRTYWIPMTIAIVLKPDFTGTFARGVLRIDETMAGLFLATVLLHFVHPGIALDIALLALFTLLLRWIGPANYGIFVIAISALVVLLISMTGGAAGPVIAARALNTALGGLSPCSPMPFGPPGKKRRRASPSPMCWIPIAPMPAPCSAPGRVKVRTKSAASASKDDAQDRTP